MISIQSVKVYNLATAIKSSGISYDLSPIYDTVEITKHDLKRCNKLSIAGFGEDKFLRLINVSFTLTASKYFMSEFDTYHFSERNSQGTLRCFPKYDQPILQLITDSHIDAAILDRFKEILEEYKQEPSEFNRRRFRASFPEGLAIKSKIVTNYNTLKHMYDQRHNHVLYEWRVFCKRFIKQLPLADLLSLYPNDNKFDNLDEIIECLSDCYDLANLDIIEN